MNKQIQRAVGLGIVILTTLASAETTIKSSESEHQVLPVDHPSPSTSLRLHVSPRSDRVLRVDHQGEDGNPETPSQPLRSIREALSRAKPGDVIELAEGTFRETVDFQRGGTAHLPIILRGARSESGDLLTTIDPGVMLNPDKWAAAEEVGPGVYVYQGTLPFKISQIVSNGRKVASLHHRAGHFRKDKVAPYSAWEILRWDKDHKVSLLYGQAESGEPRQTSFWRTISAVYHLAEDSSEPFGEKLYIRFEDGESPMSREITAYPDQPTVRLNETGHVWIEDLNIVSGTEGIRVEGKQAVGNRIANCRISHGTTRVAFLNGANNGVIQGCELGMKFLGSPPGAWGGGGSESGARQFVYLYYKYWASVHTISNDRSIALHGSHDIRVVNNRIDGGLVGVSLIGAERVEIQGNEIKNHSSVGIVIRDNNSEIYMDSNELENNNIQFRLHNLNRGWHRGIYLVRNISILPEGVGSHIFCHVRPDGENISVEDTPEVYFLHNSFIGGNSGLSLPLARRVSGGLPKFFLINNLFAVKGLPVRGQQPFMRGDLTLGKFDYNLLIVPEGTISPVLPWFGENVLIEEGGKLISDYTPQSGSHIGKGIHLSRFDPLREARAEGFDFITEDYYLSDTPDIGAVQSTLATE